MKRRNRKSTVAKNQIIQTKVTKNVVSVIKRVQRDLQLSENFSKGNKARKITFIEASQELGRRLNQ